TKVEERANSPEDRSRIQDDLNRLERWAKTKKNEVQQRQTHLGRKNEMGDDAWLNSSMCEKDLGILMDNKLNMSQKTMRFWLA
ncbi:hypothetical protein, partial [Pseudomonas lurida]|uniref:hypothetical protein n=1 Tax=Pseudomonas lurida TaxID=244566 RepID=UPI0034D95C24